MQVQHVRDGGGRCGQGHGACYQRPELLGHRG